MLKIEELNNVKAVAFQVNCEEPEREAWYKMREWAVKNLKDFEARTYVGYAPVGHHPENSVDDSHEYIAMVLLYSHEATRFSENVIDAPKGLYLIGDVELGKNEQGQIDIGDSMKKSSQVIYESMLEMKEYDIDFCGRTFLEEQMFTKEWFTAKNPEEVQVQYKFWLPIKVK